MGKNKILYFASHHSDTHINSCIEIAHRMPEEEFLLVTAESIDKNRLPSNVIFKKITEPNCSIKLDEKIYLRKFEYVEEEVDVVGARRHVVEFVKSLEDFDPNLVVIDMTSELAIISKLLGYPTVYFYETVDNDKLRFRVVFNSVDSTIVRYPRELLSILGDKVYPNMFFAGGVSRFDAVKDEVTLGQSEEKIITFITGSKSHQSEIEIAYYSTIISGALDVPNSKLRVICPDQEVISTAAKANLSKFELITEGDNIFQLLKESNVVICSGGMGVIMESSLANVPILSIPVPWILDEQLRKSHALQRLGAVKMIDPRQMNDRKISKTIKYLLNPAKTRRMLTSQRTLIDGAGFDRISQHLDEMLLLEQCKDKLSV